MINFINKLFKKNIVEEIVDDAKENQISLKKEIIIIDEVDELFDEISELFKKHDVKVDYFRVYKQRGFNKEQIKFYASFNINIGKNFISKDFETKSKSLLIENIDIAIRTCKDTIQN